MGEGGGGGKGGGTYWIMRFSRTQATLATSWPPPPFMSPPTKSSPVGQSSMHATLWAASRCAPAISLSLPPLSCTETEAASSHEKSSRCAERRGV